MLLVVSGGGGGSELEKNFFWQKLSFEILASCFQMFYTGPCGDEPLVNICCCIDAGYQDVVGSNIIMLRVGRCAQCKFLLSFFLSFSTADAVSSMYMYIFSFQLYSSLRINPGHSRSNVKHGSVCST